MTRWVVAGRVLTAALAVVAVIAAALALVGLRQEAQDRQTADRAQTAAELDHLRAEITAEFDRRTAARNRSQAAQEARTRAAICTVLASDLSPSRSVQDLAVQLGCPLDPATGRPIAPATAEPSPSPHPPAPAPGRTPAAQPTQTRSPTPRSSPSRPSPRPSPSPSATCQLRVPLTGSCLVP